MDTPNIPFLTSAAPSPLRVECNVLAKAVGGALLFGMPLLFTMEMWWIGEFTANTRIVAFLLVAFVLNMALAHLSGFRREHSSLLSDAAQAAEAMAVGIVVSTASLFALGRLDTATSLDATLGTIAMQVIPLSLGATVANLVFDPDVGRAHDANDGSADRSTPVRELLNDIGATLAGALFIGFAIAPTEEIPMLAAGLEAGNIVAVIALSLVAGYVIVFASGFDPSHRSRHEGGLFQGPISETVLATTISLTASALMLYGFGQIEGDGPLHGTLAQILVLAVPASIGGAAGRLVV